MPKLSTKVMPKLSPVGQVRDRSDGEGKLFQQDEADGAKEYNRSRVRI